MLVSPEASNSASSLRFCSSGKPVRPEIRFRVASGECLCNIVRNSESTHP